MVGMISKVLLGLQGLLILAVGVGLAACSCPNKISPGPSKNLSTTPLEWQYPDSLGPLGSTDRGPQAISGLTGVVTLAYYGFHPDPNLSAVTDPSLFRQQLGYLKQNGFKFLTLDEALKAAQDSSHDRQVLITIEGWSKNFAEQFAHLVREKIPVTLFLNSRDLHDSQAQEFLSQHRDHHLLSLGLRGTEMLKSIGREKALLSQLLGRVPLAFSYPTGQDPNLWLEKVKASGFSTAFSHFSGVAYKNTSPLLWPRFPLNNKFGQLVGNKKNGFELRVHTLPLGIAHLNSDRFPQTRIFYVGVETEIPDARLLNCYYNGAPVARVARLAKHEAFAASMKNWGHRYEIRLRDKPKGAPLLRCTLLAKPGTNKHPPRFHWGTLRLPETN